MMFDILKRFVLRIHIKKIIVMKNIFRNTLLIAFLLTLCITATKANFEKPVSPAIVGR
jgi:predicted permease